MTKPRRVVSPLTKYRISHDLSYEAAGKAAGISASSWYRIEHGETTVRPKTAKRIAAMLKIPAISLVKDPYRDEEVA